MRVDVVTANYIPISLTCISCKNMEHVNTKHVLNHLESNNLLYDLQHGFRHSRSCETQLLSFVQEIAANSDKNIQTDLNIMDFAKAFDKVPHQRLLYKLKFYGIKNQTLTWISAFFSLSWLDFIYSDKSLIYTRKRTGPRTVP
jgi:hypothetical protein